MKMMVWNCGKGFVGSNKFRKIKDDTDISIILECDLNERKKMRKEDREAWGREKENLKIYAEYRYDNLDDVGKTEKKCFGFAIFVHNDKYELEEEKIIDEWLKQFLVFTINNKVRVVVYHGNPDGLNGIGDLRYAIDKYKTVFFGAMPVFICGDFNSNTNNDYKKPFHSHREFENIMETYGMKSYYDIKNGYRAEKKPTWRQRRMNKGGAENHIDYFWGRKEFFEKDKFSIGDSSWYRYSDHVPLFIELNDDIIFN